MKNYLSMKDREKLKELSLEDLQAMLIKSLAEVCNPHIGYSKTRELIKDIKKIKSVIKHYPEEVKP